MIINALSVWNTLFICIYIYINLDRSSVIHKRSIAIPMRRGRRKHRRHRRLCWKPCGEWRGLIMNWSSKGVWCRGLGDWEKSQKSQGKNEKHQEIHKKHLAHFLAIAPESWRQWPQQKGVLFWNSETHCKAKAYFCSRSMDLICWNLGCDRLWPTICLWTHWSLHRCTCSRPVSFSTSGFSLW